LTGPRDDTGQPAKNITDTDDDFESTSESADDNEHHVWDRSVKRMEKALTAAFSVIKEAGAKVYNEWSPSIDVPELGDDFDPSDVEALEMFEDEVREFLEKLEKEEESKSKANQKTGALYKFGRGIKSVAFHIFPFIRTAIKFGKDSGLVKFIPLLKAYGLDSCAI
jgi:hypothetical protein